MKTECTLNQSEKDLWKKHCKSLGLTQSAVLRMLINKEIKENNKTLNSINESGDDDKKIHKITIRLSGNNVNKLKNKMNLEGYLTPTNWVVACVIYSLNKQPILTENEIFALRESNREISALGGNLNQIARVLNKYPDQSRKLTPDIINDLKTQFHNHNDKVIKLIKATKNRWE